MTKEEWVEWRGLPETQEYLAFLGHLRETAKEAWANAAYTSEAGDEGLQLNARAIGRVQLLEDLINLEYETLESRDE